MEDKNLTKRQIQLLHTKEKIYDTAFKLMVKEGYDKLTIRQICKEAGVSIGSFYNHFKTKEDIFLEYIKMIDKHYEEDIIKNLKSANALDQIVEFICYTIQLIAKNGVEIATLVYINKAKIASEFFISKERLILTLIKNIVIAGQQKNEISNDMTAEEITDEILMFTRGIIYDWCLHNGNYDMEQKANKIMNRLIKSYKP